MNTTVDKPRNRFWLWILWALGIRTVQADNEYGERLANYRRWSSIPVMLMSLAVFIYIAIKITLLTNAFIGAFQSLDPERVVNSYALDTPIEQIILDSMLGILTVLLQAVPLWLSIPAFLLWFLAFCLDFAVSAYLAEHKKLWWKRHWGGIITALFTIP